jgi:micrococcal nuclease
LIRDSEHVLFSFWTENPFYDNVPYHNTYDEHIFVVILASKAAAKARPAALCALACALAAAGAARPVRAETLPGPVRAEVLSVIDGDTILVRARIWLDLELSVHVRLAGVDAPELRGRCAEERELAVRARALVERAVGSGRVVLSELEHDKYAGRVVARVTTADGFDLAGALVAAGLARSYDGGRRPSWCVAAEIREP